MPTTPTTFTDTFTDTNGTVLSDHTSDTLGIGWTVDGGYSGGASVIQSGKLVESLLLPGSATCTYEHDLLLATPEVSLTYQIGPRSGGGSEISWSDVGVGVGDVLTYYADINFGGTVYRYELTTPTEGTQVTAWVSIDDPTHVYTLRLTFGASTVEMYVDGVLVLSGTKTTSPIGLRAFLKSSVPVAVPYAGHYIDDWTLEDAVDAGGPTPIPADLGFLRDTGGAILRASLADRSGGIVVPPTTALRDTGGAICRMAVQNGNRAVLELYFAGAGHGVALSGVFYGQPTRFTIDNPQAGREYILEAPVADLAGFLSGKMGNVKLRRLASGGNYVGSIVVRAVELYYKESNG